MAGSLDQIKQLSSSEIVQNEAVVIGGGEGCNEGNDVWVFDVLYRDNGTTSVSRPLTRISIMHH